MATNKKTSKGSTGKKAAIGAGLALAAIAGYFLATTKPNERKKILNGWIDKAKDETSKRFKQAKVFTEAGYRKAAAEVMKDYEGIKNIDAKEFSKIGKELNDHWRTIAKSFKKGREGSSEDEE